MDGDGEFDPTKPEDQGATGGSDENPQDYNLPGGPTDSPDERRRWWQKGGARPKYQKLPQDDKDIPMSEFPKENNGIPEQTDAADLFP